MKVLHVYSGNMYGGVETLLVTLARCRAEAPALHPEFALCVEGRLSRELAASGVSVHVLGMPRLRNPFSVGRARRLLAARLKREAVDVVICHSPWTEAVFGPAIRRAGLPLVFWLHGAVTGRHWLERLAGRTRPDLAVCNSFFTAGTLPQLYPDLEPQVLYCPVSAPVLDQGSAVREEVRAGLRCPAESVVIVMASRMEEWKGHLDLIRALDQLSLQLPWVCWIAGAAQNDSERAYERAVRQTAAESRVGDRIRFIGQRDDVSRLLAAADIHCQPNSGPEPFGIGFVEALYSGLPCVTTAIGGAREIVDETCGILVPAGDEVALGRALERLIRDPALRARYSENAVKRARLLCDPAAQIPELQRLLSTVVAA